MLRLLRRRPRHCHRQYTNNSKKHNNQLGRPWSKLQANLLYRH